MTTTFTSATVEGVNSILDWFDNNSYRYNKYQSEQIIKLLAARNENNIDQVEKNNKVEFSQRTTLLNIDSRFRDTDLYPNAAQYTLPLEQKFRNIHSVTLTRISGLPNVSQPVDETNNTLYWINEEDEDLGYPVYSVKLTPGQYDLLEIQNECNNELNNNVRRRGGTGIPHVFDVQGNQNTDLVQFTSLITSGLDLNPLATTANSPKITVTKAAHNFAVGTVVYLTGLAGIIGGLDAANVTGGFKILQVPDVNTFVIEATGVCSQDSSACGGGNVTLGIASPFKFLFGSYTNTPINLIGFPPENSADKVTVTNPLLTYTVPIVDLVPGQLCKVVAPLHGLMVGDTVQLQGVSTIPSTVDVNAGIFEIVMVSSADEFFINFDVNTVVSLNDAYVSTSIITMTLPDHKFNQIIDIEYYSATLTQLTFLLPHGYSINSGIVVSQSDSVPSINGNFTVHTVVSADTLLIETATPISTRGSFAIDSVDQTFNIYGATNFGGLNVNTAINNKDLRVRNIVDDSHFTFDALAARASKIEQGGGVAVYFSSKRHGFNGVQSNFRDNAPYQAIALAGEDYAFLVCPLLESMQSPGCRVRGIFAKVELTQPVGFQQYILNRFDSLPKIFQSKPLAELDALSFEIRSPTNSLFNFFNRNWSCSIEIVEDVRVDLSMNRRTGLD